MDLRTNSGQPFSTSVWNTTVITLDDLSNSIAQLQDRKLQNESYLLHKENNWASASTFLGYGKCQYNFCKLQISGVIIDPFSADFEKVYNKLVVLAQFAAAVGFYGIWFDVEPYVEIWKYNNLPLRSKYTFAQYQQRYYEIGYGIALQWRKANPNLSVMTTSAYDGFAGQGLPYEANQYGLYKNFLDGLFDGWGDFYYRLGVRGTGKIIVTTEGTFSLTNLPNIIRYGYRQMSGQYDSYINPGNPPTVLGTPPPDQTYWGGSSYFFDTNIKEIGLAIWPTAPFYNPLGLPEDNQWAPDTFRDALKTMIDYCQWIWIYNPDWSFYNGSSGDLDPVYIAAIEEARVYGKLPE
jgi:hypothetical protein